MFLHMYKQCTCHKFNIPIIVGFEKEYSNETILIRTCVNKVMTFKFIQPTRQYACVCCIFWHYRKNKNIYKNFNFTFCFHIYAVIRDMHYTHINLKKICTHIWIDFSTWKCTLYGIALPRKLLFGDEGGDNIFYSREM